MDNCLFVIPCRFSLQSPFIFQCVEKITHSNPTACIVVVDSNSEDKSYFDKILQYKNLTILDIENKNYDTGAYWAAYNEFPGFDFYGLIHDSLTIDRCCTDLREFHSLRYFLSAPLIGGIKLGFSSMLNKRLLISQKFFGKTSLVGHGFTNQEQYNWASSYLSLLGLDSFPSYWLSLFGPIMFTPKSVLDDLVAIDFHTVLPNSKIQQMGMELLWGLALKKVGIDVSKCLQGDHFSCELNSKGFDKTISSRQ